MHEREDSCSERQCRYTTPSLYTAGSSETFSAPARSDPPRLRVLSLSARPPALTRIFLSLVPTAPPAPRTSLECVVGPKCLWRSWGRGGVSPNTNESCVLKYELGTLISYRHIGQTLHTVTFRLHLYKWDMK